MLQFFFSKGEDYFGTYNEESGNIFWDEGRMKFTGLENSTLNSSIGVAECHSTEMAHYLG